MFQLVSLELQQNFNLKCSNPRCLKLEVERHGKERLIDFS